MGGIQHTTSKRSVLCSRKLLDVCPMLKSVRGVTIPNPTHPPEHTAILNCDILQSPCHWIRNSTATVSQAQSAARIDLVGPIRIADSIAATYLTVGLHMSHSTASAYIHPNWPNLPGGRCTASSIRPNKMSVPGRRAELLTQIIIAADCIHNGHLLIRR